MGDFHLQNVILSGLKDYINKIGMTDQRLVILGKHWDDVVILKGSQITGSRVCFNETVPIRDSINRFWSAYAHFCQGVHFHLGSV